MDNSTITGRLLHGTSSITLDLDPSINICHHGGSSQVQARPAVPNCHVLPSHGTSPSPSDEEDDSFAFGESAKQESQWHRMKWTDEMVRLLVTVVAFINDEGTPDPVEAAARRRSILQKKGKWKAVSKLMKEKGCFVSPQQCEDKFNDLNKRYKRLNEILGRGTTCMVVENPALLESMTYVSAKMKEDVKKILSSKHLFYREMCAYHNGQTIPDSHIFGLKSEILACSGILPEVGQDSEDGDDDDEKSEEYGQLDIEEFLAEIDLVFQDNNRTASEKLDWFQRRALQIKQERLVILSDALELKKRNFKWQRFRSKKDREMEKMRLENERLMKENERMILELRQKELEFTSWRSREASDPAAYRMDMEH
ncbi:uncharacterized protein LOC110029937 [Phalaenopsis equestris]|uniref:uncharacterized protein LOC110029937 n=1 Tax=Phalaenopsis equestris TaxID=78828 RepID=UPI0009E5AC05|nr:uncharacterized protein LOC110029937 [Phalaenopsis equestris]